MKCINRLSGSLVLVLLIGCTCVLHPVAIDEFEVFSAMGIIPQSVSKNISGDQLTKAAAFEKPCSVALVNPLEDLGEQLAFKHNGYGHLVNYYEWTQFFIDELSKQLAKLGCTVSGQSPNKIVVRLFGFSVESGAWVMKSKISVELKAISREFRYTYNGYARRISLDFSAAVYQTIAQLLRNEDVRKQLEVQKSSNGN